MTANILLFIKIFGLWVEKSAKLMLKFKIFIWSINSFILLLHIFLILKNIQL